MPRGEAEAALAPAGLDELSGLVDVDGESVIASCALHPFEGLLVAHDRDERGALPPAFVTGVNAASRTLASLTVRRSVASALDVGAGSGVQALLAARHAERVVGTDINERAIRFAELNARLNGFQTIEHRVGSLFDPVDGETFDLVVSNPPYVVSPDATYVYRDSGRAGDEISREVVSRAPAFLAEGGYASILCNWVVEDDGDPTARVGEWASGRGCDAWVLHYATQEPAAYAARWNDGLRLRDPSSYGETVERWIEYYERERIEAIGIGGVVLRRREGANWTRTDTVPLAPNGAASDQILRVFDAQSRLAAIRDDTELLDERFALVEPHRLDQALLYEGGEYTAQDAALVLERGVGLRGAVDAHAIHVLFGLNGDRPLRAIVEDAAETTGLERGLVERHALATVRRLYELGFVVLAR